eukprot:scaffold167741_cov34-Tisochrysis_lutea.AAC.9
MELRALSLEEAGRELGALAGERVTVRMMLTQVRAVVQEDPRFFLDAICKPCPWPLEQTFDDTQGGCAAFFACPFWQLGRHPLSHCALTTPFWRAARMRPNGRGACQCLRYRRCAPGAADAA